MQGNICLSTATLQVGVLFWWLARWPQIQQTCVNVQVPVMTAAATAIESFGTALQRGRQTPAGDPYVVQPEFEEVMQNCRQGLPVSRFRFLFGCSSISKPVSTGC